jgi:hypothetical protein
MDSEIIFIHNLKAGGSSIIHFLSLKSNNEEIKRIKITKCINNNYLEKISKDKYLILNIRNPFNHYISIYNYPACSVFSTTRKNRDTAYQHKKPNFKVWIKNLLNLTFKESNYYEEEIMKKFDIGFISARIFLAIYGDKINSIHNGDDLLNNIPKMSNINEFIRVEDININNHVNKKRKSSNLKEYYNKDLFRLVRHKERYILDYFNYDKRWKNY